MSVEISIIAKVPARTVGTSVATELVESKQDTRNNGRTNPAPAAPSDRQKNHLPGGRGPTGIGGGNQVWEEIERSVIG